MTIFHPVQQFTVLPVFGIPTSLFPVHNTRDPLRARGARNNDISEGEIPMSEIDIARVRKEVPIWASDSFWPRSLTSGGSKQPIIKRLDGKERSLFIIKSEEPVLYSPAINRS